MNACSWRFRHFRMTDSFDGGALTAPTPVHTDKSRKSQKAIAMSRRTVVASVGQTDSRSLSVDETATTSGMSLLRIVGLRARFSIYPILQLLASRMINIYGTPGTSEYSAAEALRTLIVSDWPEADDVSFGDIRLIPSAKCFGEKIQDIDLIVIGRLRKPHKLLALNGKETPYLLLSFFWTIEVKGHRVQHVVFEGGKVFVKYKEGKASDATEQSEGQKYSVMRYLERNKITPAPHIRNFVWLTNIPSSQIPVGINNVFGSDVTWRGLLHKFLVLEEPYLASKGRQLIDCIYPQGRPHAVLQSAELFTKVLETTPLNRKKVEMITERILDGQKYSEKLGDQFLSFRGRGGTGKTIRLLRIAYDLYVSRDAKVLILTYNLALVADIRRLFAIMQIPTEADAPSIQVRSIHSYLYKTLKDLGLNVAPQLFLQNFKKLKEEALALEAISPGDIEYWDFVLVDEAQDWPPDERDLLFKLFGPLRIVVADGVDQLVRGTRPLHWPEAIGKRPRQIVSLAKSLRLKANLCRFANELAGELGFMGWKLDVAEELHGGHIVVVLGAIDNMRSPMENEIVAATNLGNAPVDMLVCCPPSLASKEDRAHDLLGDELEGDESEVLRSRLAEVLEGWGNHVWDGASSDIRRIYPTDINQLRLVQYDSCRGLEGWSVFCFGLDELFDYKLRSFDPASVDPDLFISQEEAAARFAKSWLMIPMTRAIDTLVIHVNDRNHRITEALRAISTRMPGVIDWIELGEESLQTPTE